jgi:soluble lytic murein transglycosylase-like protein
VANRPLALLAVAVAAVAAVTALPGRPGGGTSADDVAEAALFRNLRPCPLPTELERAFEASALDTGLPLALLVALGQIESSLDPTAVSSAGAHGVLQVLPSTAAELGLDAADPTSNVYAGARYLRAQLDRFRSLDLALAAYHAGPTAVARAGGIPDGGTRAYVTRVTVRWLALGDCR